MHTCYQARKALRIAHAACQGSNAHACCNRGPCSPATRGYLQAQPRACRVRTGTRTPQLWALHLRQPSTKKACMRRRGHCLLAGTRTAQAWSVREALQAFQLVPQAGPECASLARCPECASLARCPECASLARCPECACLAGCWNGPAWPNSRNACPVWLAGRLMTWPVSQDIGPKGWRHIMPQPIKDLSLRVAPRAAHQRPDQRGGATSCCSPAVCPHRIHSTSAAILLGLRHVCIKDGTASTLSCSAIHLQSEFKGSEQHCAVPRMMPPIKKAKPVQGH